ncbi:unnamed protein product, partial [Coregonus sp. 'balchen']
MATLGTPATTLRPATSSASTSASARMALTESTARTVRVRCQN